MKCVNEAIEVGNDHVVPDSWEECQKNITIPEKSAKKICSGFLKLKTFSILPEGKIGNSKGFVWGRRQTQ